MGWYEILFHVFMILCLIGLLIAIIIYCGEQAWIMAELKNKCIAECVAFNKDAIAQGIAERCVC